MGGFTAVILIGALVELIQPRRFVMDDQIQAFQLMYLKNYLRIYDKYDLLFHIDVGQVHVTNRLISFAERDSLNAVAVFNYEAKGRKNLTRPSSTKYVHVVVLNNPCWFDRYARKRGSLNYLDIVAFIVNTIQLTGCLKINGEIKPFWFMNRLNVAGNVIIINMSLTSVSVSNTCYYCGEQSKVLKLLQKTASASIKLNQVDVLPRYFQNFQGHLITVSYRNYFPFFLCLEEQLAPEQLCNRSVGLESTLLEALSQKLNFTYKLTGINSTFGDNVNGIAEGEINFAVGGIIMSSELLKHVSFTISIKSEDYTFLYVLSVPFWDRILGLLRPFRLPSWATILFLITIVSFFLYCFMKVSGNALRNFNMARSVDICLRSIIEQNAINYQFASKVRCSVLLLLAVWWLACLEIDALYRTNLASMLINPPHPEPSDLRELLVENFDILINDNTSDFILKANIKLIQRSFLIKKHNICEMLQFSLENKAAVLDEFSKIQYHSYYFCPNVTDQIVATHQLNNFRITRKPLLRVSYGWPLTIGAAYKKTFDKIIGSLQAGGFIDKWSAESVASKKITPFSYSKQKGIIYREITASLFSYSSLFIIYSIGTFIATICFLLEIKLFKHDVVYYGYNE